MEGSVQETKEAMLHLVYTNPIAVMICALNGYVFKVEDRVVVSEEGSDDDDDNLYQ